MIFFGKDILIAIIALLVLIAMIAIIALISRIALIAIAVMTAMISPGKSAERNICSICASSRFWSLLDMVMMCTSGFLRKQMMMMS